MSWHKVVGNPCHATSEANVEKSMAAVAEKSVKMSGSRVLGSTPPPEGEIPQSQSCRSGPIEISAKFKSRISTKNEL